MTTTKTVKKDYIRDLITIIEKNGLTTDKTIIDFINDKIDFINGESGLITTGELISVFKLGQIDSLKTIS